MNALAHTLATTLAKPWGHRGRTHDCSSIGIFTLRALQGAMEATVGGAVNGMVKVPLAELSAASSVCLAVLRRSSRECITVPLRPGRAYSWSRASRLRVLHGHAAVEPRVFTVVQSPGRERFKVM